MHRPILKISKTGAAKRQLETAIRLWFHDSEPVSIHTLTAASHQIIHDLGTKRGIKTVLRDYPRLNPQHEKKLHEIIYRYENFFKHANSDPDAILDFNPDATVCYLLDAVIAYEALTRERPVLFRTLQMWMLIQNPEMISTEFKEDWNIKLPHIKQLMKTTSKTEFFRLYPAAIAQYESA